MKPRAACRVVLVVLLAAGCDLFQAREPEDPIGDAGTWLQPDTPERVVENLQNAVAELNTQNYLRSLADPFTFEPTVAAESREPLLASWTRAEEEAYFTRLKAAAEPFSGRSLQLFDTAPSIVGDDVYVLAATYQLTIPHSRADENVPTDVQGRVLWEIVQGADGLWRLRSWTDQELGGNASWSDLKAAFVK